MAARRLNDVLTGQDIRARIHAVALSRILRVCCSLARGCVSLFGQSTEFGDWKSKEGSITRTTTTTMTKKNGPYGVIACAKLAMLPKNEMLTSHAQDK